MTPPGGRPWRTMRPRPGRPGSPARPARAGRPPRPGRSGRSVGLRLIGLVAASLLGLPAAGVGATATRSAAVSAADASSIGSSSTIVFGAGGGRVVSQLAIPFRATGGLTVTFHGDPAAGCLAAGDCADSGTIFAPIPASGMVIVLALASHRRTSEQALAFPNPSFNSGPYTTSVVNRARPGTDPGRCTDATSSTGSLAVTVHRARVSVRLLTPGSHLLATRCAGPTDAGLAPVAPQVELSVGALRAGRRTVDLSGTRPFTSGGYAGTLSSTIVLHLGIPRRQRLNSGGQFPPGIPVVRERIVQARLTLTRVTGSLRADVTGAAAPVCQPLDSCGLQETVALPAAATGAAGSLFVQARASSPLAAQRAALGLAGPPAAARAARTLPVNGGVSFTDPGPVLVTATQDGTTCHGRGGPAQEDVQLAARSGRLIATLESLDLSRSGCPGPLLGSGSDPIMLATGSVPLGALGHRTIPLRLRAATAPVADDGYVIRLAGTATFTLRRGRVSQTVLRAPGF
jgi:hypothetical protein